MPLFYYEYEVDYSEKHMQNEVVKAIRDISFYKRKKPAVFTEITVRELGRRSDIIVYFTRSRIFNIECKLKIGNVLEQAKDHLRWANYSIICIPGCTYIKKSERIELLGLGIGLMLYDDETGVLYEALQPVYRYHSRKKNLVRKYMEIMLSAKKQQLNIKKL